MKNKEEIPKKETNKKTNGVLTEANNIKNKHIRAIVKGAILFFGFLIPTVFMIILFRSFIGKIILLIFALVFIFWALGRMIDAKPPTAIEEYRSR